MFKKIAFITLAFSAMVLNAIPVSFNMTSVSFTDCLSNESYQKNLTIYNNSTSIQNITINHNNRSFTFSDTLFTILGQDSTSIVVSFNGKHNILYKDVFYFTNSINQNPSVIQAEAPVHYTLSLYNSTYNLWDTQLKTALHNAVYNHTSLGYNTSRHYMFSDIDNVNGFVECVYTGMQYETDDTPSDGNTMNTEHTWPQSMFLPEDDPTQRCDLHHLYPTKSTANSIRGNLPFGIIVGIPTWSEGGSKKGYNANNVLCFEPRDIHKGDCARSMFYFSLVYNNPNTFLDYQEGALRAWHIQDPVSTKEVNRNNDIQTYQGNRNPFVDHPEYMERIYSLSSNANRPTTANYYFPSQNINVNNQGTFSIAIANYGNANLTINSATSSNPVFVVGNITTSITPVQFGTIEMTAPTSTTTQTTTLTIQTSIGVKTINITTQSTSNDDIIISKPNAINVNIYPNPIKNYAEIKINSTSPMSNNTNLEIFNVKGQKVEAINLPANKSNQLTHTISFDKKIYTSGVYFVKINQGNTNQIKKILIIK